MEESNDPKGQSANFQAAVQHIQTLIENKKYKKAYELLKIQLHNTPKQPEFVQLYSQFKRQYTHDKIQKLQQHADMLLRSGDEDKAQEIFREIYRLDPRRTELKDSFRKTRSEIKKDYNKRVLKTEFIDFCTKILVVIIAVGLFATGWRFWSNKQHLKQSEKYIVSLDLSLARQELDQCGRFFCPQKDEVSKKLRITVENLIAQAYQEIENKNFERAQDYLNLARQGARDKAPIEQAVAYCQQQQRQWLAELARQEEQRLLSEKAMAAKTTFNEKLIEAIQNEAEVDAADIIALAKTKNENANALFENSEFDAAYKQWLEAAEDCNKAKITAIEILQKRKATLVFKTICDETIVRGENVNAPVEANEIWIQATAAFNNANAKFTANQFEDAAQLWQQASDKYAQAIEYAKQSASYGKALTYANKWKILKAGLAEENIRQFLGEPVCVQSDSDKRIWYYGYSPTLRKDSQGVYQCSMPQCGYVVFAAAGIQTLIDKNNEIYEKQTVDERQSHSRIISDLNNQIDEENRRYNNRIQITNPAYQKGTYPKIQQRPNSDYYSETKKHNDTIKNLNNAIEKENQRHHEKLIKLQKDRDERNYILVHGLMPREPKYSTSEWQMPDVENLKCFMQVKADDEKTVRKPGFKWHIPAKWRGMKLNISEGDVIEMFGEPDCKYNENGAMFYRYGELAEYGLVRFETCVDSVVRVKAWKEPLWIYVAAKLDETQEAVKSEE